MIKPDSRQIRKVGALPKLGTVVNDSVENVLNQIHTEVDSPLRLSASSTPDSKLNFSSTSLSRADSANIVASPVKKQIFSTLSSPWINFQTQAVSSASDFDISWPSSNTVGRYRNVGFTLIGSGKIKALFSSEAVSEGALSNPGALFVNGGLPIGYITIECTNIAGYFKTAGSATNIIENTKIFRLAAGGGASSSSSSSAGGGELADLLYKAAIRDSFVDIPDGTTTIDITSGKTDATLHDVANELIRINYDASKTITGTGTAITISGSPSFTIKTGDIIIYNSEARRITALASQVSVTIESAFSVDPSASSACISQAIHTVDLNNFTAGGTGLAASSQFTGNIDEVMVGYADSETSGDIIPDFGSSPVIGFDVSANGTSWSGVKLRQTSLSSSEAIASTPTSSTNLYLRFFANKSSGTGAVNLLSYKVFFHKQVGQTAGVNYYTAFARPTSSIAQNCSHGVVGGKSRFTFTWSYTRGLNPTEASGSALEVIVNGQIVPRYIASVTDTSGAYFTEISDNVIEMDTDYSTYGVDFQFKVKSLNIIDTNTNNTTRLTNLENYAQSITDLDRVMLPTTSVPYTAIVGRANVTDFSADLSTIMGINRIMVQQHYLIQNEFGASGETVFGAVNDLHNMIRFVGNWTAFDNVDGIYIRNTTTTDYAEITFYGTGLNIVLRGNSTDDLRVTVDGGTEGASSIVSSSLSSILLGRNYSSNMIFNATSGLSLGFHTVKFRYNAAATGGIQGFEVLNDRTTLLHNPGSMFSRGNKVTSTSSTSSYNSGFESGTLGTRGGRVLVYQKSDGTIAKALTPTNTSSAVLSSADHTNEEMVRKYYPREFGAGRSDDFSTLTTTQSPRAFTLDDGVTTLTASAARLSALLNSTEALYGNAANDFITFTFVGTGLDLILYDTAAVAGGTNTYSIDGATATSIGYTTGSTSIRTVKIVSGLPYGTHTFRLNFVSGTTFNQAIVAFNVYQPKKPTLPSGSVEIADYNIMADFVANTTAGLDTVSTGILRKTNVREMNYVGTWSVSAIAPSNYTNGFGTSTSTNGGYVQYTFFGTGFDYRFYTDPTYTSTATVTINGLTATTTNFPSMISSVTSPATFNSSTGVLAQNVTNGSGRGLRISGLPLALYTVRITNGTASGMDVASFDVITPIYSAKSQLPYDLQNTLPIGNISIGDSRKIKNDLIKSKNISQAIGLTSSPTTTSTSFVPANDLSVTHNSVTGRIRIIYRAHVTNSVGNDTYLQPYVNGLSVSTLVHATAPVTAYSVELSGTDIVNVPIGINKIDIYWKVSAGTGSLQSVERLLIVEDI